MIKYCKRCKKLINSLTDFCYDCYLEEEKDEIKVASFVRDIKNNVTLDEIYEATGVKKSTIMKMIKSRRLIPNNVEIHYPCDMCGKTIVSGNLCGKCLVEITTNSKEIKKKNNTFHNSFNRE